MKSLVFPGGSGVRKEERNVVESFTEYLLCAEMEYLLCAENGSGGP